MFFFGFGLRGPTDAADVFISCAESIVFVMERSSFLKSKIC
jgi:hypothetical protein